MHACKIAGLEAFSFMGWVQRKIGGRGFAVRKVLVSQAALSVDHLFEGGEHVEQCWSWYLDSDPGLHISTHNYSAPRYSTGPWADGKIHLEALVVNRSHVVMYQDLRVARVQTLAEALNLSQFPLPDCSPSAGKNISLEIGGSGLRLADIKFFRHALTVEEMNTTFVRGLPSKVIAESLIGNAHRGWIPRQPGAHTWQTAAEAAARLSDASPESAADMLQHANQSDARDANRTRQRVETAFVVNGLQKIERHFLGGEYSQGAHRAVQNGFRIVEQNTSDRAAWGFRDCPFLFNAGAPIVPDVNRDNFSDYSNAHLVRVCLDEPTRTQNLHIPDAHPDPLSTPPRPLPMGTEYERDLLYRQGNQPWSRTYSFSSKQHRWLPALSGVVISTGNLHDLAGVPGLFSRVPSFQFSGSIGRPEKQQVRRYETLLRARVSCSYGSRSNSSAMASGESNLSSAAETFNSHDYRHKWAIVNVSTYLNTTGQTYAESTTLLRRAVDAPVWFYLPWQSRIAFERDPTFDIDNLGVARGSASSLLEQTVPLDIYDYLFPEQTCYFRDPLQPSAPLMRCNLSDVNESLGYFARDNEISSFVAMPRLRPFLNLTGTGIRSEYVGK